MNTKVRPAIVGAFVLGAFGLGLLALLSFGSINFLHKREGFVIFFAESIQGLTQGSPVKMSGVTLGRVTDTHVRYNPATNQSLVEVDCEFDRNVIIDSEGHTVDVNGAGEVQRLVDRGLRAQLIVTGLATGLQIVDLAFVDPKLNPAAPVPRSIVHADYPAIPARPSAFADFENNAIEITTELKRIDFEKLAANVDGLLTELRGLVQDAHGKIDTLDLAALSRQWQQAGAAVTTLASAPEIRRTFVTLDRTLADVRATINRLDRQVDANGQNLNQTLSQAQTTLKQFNAAAATLQRFIAAQSGLGDSAAQAFNELSSAADAVQRLADFLERNPSALLSGRKPSQ